MGNISLVENRLVDVDVAAIEAAIAAKLIEDVDIVLDVDDVYVVYAIEVLSNLLDNCATDAWILDHSVSWRELWHSAVAARRGCAR